MANVYLIGVQVRLSATFATSAGVATDPTTVIVKYAAPGASVVTKTYGVDAAVVKDSTGHYHIDLDLSTAGEWSYRWTGSGTLVAAAETQMIVEGTRVV